MTDAPPPSALDRLIQPEINHDRFYRAIAEIAAADGVRQMLEIGSSSGAGSTEAFVAGAVSNPYRPTLHCLEVSKGRFAALVERYRGYDFVRCYNLSSVSLEKFASAEEVARFYRQVRSKLRKVPLERVLGWLEEDRAYVAKHGISGDGIREIKRANGIDVFDVVLIDGSEFTGRAELDEVYGAGFILLDDILSYKNWDNFRRLSKDASYRLVKKSRWLRNGFAIFRRADSVP